MLRDIDKNMRENHKAKISAISLRQDKIAGYGGSPKKYIDPFLPRFKVIYYSKGQYQVVDRYTGQEQNIGQTIYFYHKQPVYGLNYYGIVKTKRLKADIIFDFLKEALRAGSGKSVHRGLNGYKKNKWLYRNKFSEKRGFVEGEERIYYRERLVYIQLYHGGEIKDQGSYGEWVKNLLPKKELERKIKL